uniref:Uncharacterized protein n=1 Tax=Caenorhabditis japonica TaxID=281687 RepID=A0A8R1EGQ1_CAEJA
MLLWTLPTPHTLSRRQPPLISPTIRAETTIGTEKFGSVGQQAALNARLGARHTCRTLPAETRTEFVVKCEF